MLLSYRIHGLARFGKALDLIFPKLSSQNMRGFDHATILSPSLISTVSARNTRHNDPPFVSEI